MPECLPSPAISTGNSNSGRKISSPKRVNFPTASSLYLRQQRNISTQRCIRLHQTLLSTDSHRNLPLCYFRRRKSRCTALTNLVSAGLWREVAINTPCLWRSVYLQPQETGQHLASLFCHFGGRNLAGKVHHIVSQLNHSRTGEHTLCRVWGGYYTFTIPGSLS